MFLYPGHTDIFHSLTKVLFSIEFSLHFVKLPSSRNYGYDQKTEEISISSKNNHKIYTACRIQNDAAKDGT